MGVLGLWELIDSVGHPIKLEGLEGKRFGVDANIWLFKFIKGFRNKDNATSIEGHKLGLYLRLCKLLFYKIKPVFIFDGPAPTLKRRTLERRQQTRNKELNKLTTSSMKLLATHLKNQFPDIDIDQVKINMPELESTVLVPNNEDRDLFYLPPVTENQDNETESESDSDVETHTGKVDIHSEDFKLLTPEARYEILQDIKSSRRRIRGALPENAQDFSNKQFQRLLAKRSVQEKIEECEREICSNYTGDTREFKMQSDPTATMILINNRSDSNPPTQRDVQKTPLFREPELAPNQSEEEEPSSPPSRLNHLEKTIVISDDDSISDSDTFVPLCPMQNIKQSPLIVDLISDSDSDSDSDNNSDENSKKKHEDIQQSQTISENSNCVDISTKNTKRVTSKIVEDAKELLTLFGVPFIEAPGEAEAQCAVLERLGLTEGTITDDSDIWLFGAQNVYRNFFNEDKYVMQYKMKDIEFHIKMNRENLICFAMLVGSDYTDGIMNVGPVSALEIISEFPGKHLKPLIKFRNFMNKYKGLKDKLPSNRKREKMLKFELPDEFPSRVVYDGYMKFVADTSTDKFTWGTPDLDELREYARRNFGWDQRKIDEKLLPVMKKINERRTQPTIDSFFFRTAANQNPELFRSKRVNDALKKLSNTEVCLTDEEDISDDDKSSSKSTQLEKKTRTAKRTKTSKTSKATKETKASTAKNGRRKRQKQD